MFLSVRKHYSLIKTTTEAIEFYTEFAQALLLRRHRSIFTRGEARSTKVQYCQALGDEVANA